MAEVELAVGAPFHAAHALVEAGRLHSVVQRDVGFHVVQLLLDLLVDLLAGGVIDFGSGLGEFFLQSRVDILAAVRGVVVLADEGEAVADRLQRDAAVAHVVGDRIGLKQRRHARQVGRDDLALDADGLELLLDHGHHGGLVGGMIHEFHVHAVRVFGLGHVLLGLVQVVLDLVLNIAVVAVLALAPQGEGLLRQPVEHDLVEIVNVQRVVHCHADVLVLRDGAVLHIEEEILHGLGAVNHRLHVVD